MAVTVEVIGTHSSPVTMYAVAPGRTIPDSEEAWKKAILEAGIRAQEAAIAASVAQLAAEQATSAASTAAQDAAAQALLNFRYYIDDDGDVAQYDSET